MQELRNRTPYAIAVAPFVLKDGRSVAAVIVKGTFDLINQFVGISQPGINEFGKSCFPEIF